MTAKIKGKTIFKEKESAVNQINPVTLTKDFQIEIKAEQQQIKSLKKRIAASPEGELHVAKNKQNYQFYCRIGKGPEGRRYLSKSEEALVSQLAQKEYEKDLLAGHEKNLKAMTKIVDLLRELTDPEAVYQALKAPLSEYVNPGFVTAAEYVAEWMALGGKADSRLDYYADALVYSTDRGEKVRSKSEMMIANLLYAMQLPYQYEKPLKLDGKLVYPDFTILDVTTRTEVYFEHFGMMDEVDYQTAALSKMERYEMAGMEVGKDFLYSFESRQVPFNIGLIRKKLAARFGNG